LISYAKIWTAIFNDEWFLSQTLAGRGFWLQLLVYAKLVDDSGDIFVRSMTSLSAVCGADRRTTGRLVDKFVRDNKITIDKKHNGSFRLTIVNYDKWQGLKSGKDYLKEKKK